MLPFDLSQYSRESQLTVCKALYELTDRVKKAEAENAKAEKGGENE